MTNKTVKTLETEYERLAGRAGVLQTQCTKLQSEMEEIKRRIAVEQIPLRVSDHSLVRYLERKLELDMDVIRNEILSDDLITMATNMGKTGKFTIRGMDIVMKSGVIVTVY